MPATGGGGAYTLQTRPASARSRGTTFTSAATRGSGPAYNSYMVSGDSDVLIPRPDTALVAVEPPGQGAGFWVGGPSAVAADGGIYLAYRLRRPVGDGRGYAVAIAFAAGGGPFGEPGAGITQEEGQ